MKDRAMNLRLGLAALAGIAPAGALAPLGVAPLIAAGMLVSLAGPAAAQSAPKAVEPFYVIVTQDQAPLLAGAVETHYRVALLPLGQILRGDHTLDGWALVEYPASTSAYVRASEVTLAPDGKTVRTNVASRLRAANMESTSAGSWATLLSDPLTALPAGTELKVVSVENRADGTPNFFKVIAPTQARGYLRAGLYRPATPQETQDYLNRLAMGVQTGTTTPNPAAPPSDSIPASLIEPVGPGPTDPVAEPLPRATDAEPAPRVDTSLIADPAVPAQGDRPAGAPAAAPAPLVIDQSGTITGGTGDGQAPTTDPLSLTPDGLVAAFDEIRRLPFEEGEYEELIARFEQVINTLGDSPADQRVKAGLRVRADVLRLRADYRDSLRALDEGQSEARQIAARAAERIDWLRTQGGYAVIGRLVASNIYDGSSGPLMYRIVAVNTSVPRTLAYVRMDDEFLLPTLVGKVVGVRGQVTIEPTIGTRIVQAESVDTVDAPN